MIKDMAFPAASPLRQEAKPTCIAHVPVQAGSLGLVLRVAAVSYSSRPLDIVLCLPGVEGTQSTVLLVLLVPHSLLQKWPKRSILSDQKGSVYRSHSLVVAIYWPTVYLHGRELTFT